MDHHCWGKVHDEFIFDTLARLPSLVLAQSLLTSTAGDLTPMTQFILIIVPTYDPARHKDISQEMI